MLKGWSLLWSLLLASIMTKSASGDPCVPNSKWILRAHPHDRFQAARDAELVEERLRLDDVPADRVVVEVHALSVDAFVRTMLDATENAAHGGDRLGQPIPALGYGTVVRGNDKYPAGATVTGLLQAARYAVVGADGLQPFRVFPRADPHDHLGVLGISGLAAYIGMFRAAPRGGPRRGETVVVSAAAGAVGCLAAQMARLCGARVVGVAGGPRKREFLLEDLRLDAAIDYKDSTRTLGEQLDAACPDGIDFFFDNVGGDLLDEVLQRLNRHARVVICGAISHYDSGDINDKARIAGPAHYVKVAETSSTISGFNMMHYSGHFLAALRYLAWHYYRGNIRCPTHVERGVEAFGDSLEKLFAGGHVGRLVVDVRGGGATDSEPAAAVTEHAE